MSESIEVNADAPLLNTTTAEKEVRFDTTRVSELPVAEQPRHLRARALGAWAVGCSWAAVSPCSSSGHQLLVERHAGALEQLHDRRSGQQRPSVPTGRQQPINNTDIVQEIRLITNQFAAEYGCAVGIDRQRG